MPRQPEKVAREKPSLYEMLPCEAAGNDSLMRDIAEVLLRPLGRSAQKPLVWCKGFLYQAASWKTACHVVAKRSSMPGNCSHRVGFIVPTRSSGTGRWSGSTTSAAFAIMFENRSTYYLNSPCLRSHAHGGILHHVRNIVHCLELLQHLQ